MFMTLPLVAEELVSVSADATFADRYGLRFVIAVGWRLECRISRGGILRSAILGCSEPQLARPEQPCLLAKIRVSFEFSYSQVVELPRVVHVTDDGR